MACQLDLDNLTTVKMYVENEKIPRKYGRAFLKCTQSMSTELVGETYVEICFLIRLLSKGFNFNSV